jgi:hypothetical protein
VGFIEVRGKSDLEEVVKFENNLEMVQFEPRNKEHDSYESTKSEEEVEQQTPVVRRSEKIRKLVERYSPPDFHSTFVITTIDNEPKSVDEVSRIIRG